VGETQKLSSPAVQQMNDLGFMPDGKGVYFAGDDGHGWKMYVQDLAGGSPRSVTPPISVGPSHFESHLFRPMANSLSPET
jgi:Tol biopolymer transport system component